MFSSPQKRILIVDSEQHTREPLAEALRQEGFDVYEATDAEHGLSITFRLYPDAVISAEWLSGMSGPEMIAQMRSDPLMVSTPIILLAEQGNRLQSEPRADSYLPEPFELPDLLGRLRRLLRRKSLKSTGSWLKGDLRGFGLPDVLTMTQQNRLTGLLKVTGDDATKFQFLFDKGSLVWVTGPGVKGTKALYRAMRVDNGRFMFHPWARFQRKPWHDDMMIGNLLLNAVQEKDELPLLLEKLPALDALLTLATDAEHDGLGEHEVLAPLLDEEAEPLSLQALIDASEQTDLRAATDVQELLKKGILTTA